ncbi:uncharacterized protein DFL_008945 [Arthrobotrys flagrans]|uniref:RING-type E3 ubiquitin transferase n=1 Tax=Arthrobotrys flagrans TaxID=97331 RepID=A0A436ZQ81_ARTFL|nr:hypothetical protein DFL_008945 [Arthrobotrys flagrans]
MADQTISDNPEPRGERVERGTRGDRGGRGGRGRAGNRRGRGGNEGANPGSEQRTERNNRGGRGRGGRGGQSRGDRGNHQPTSSHMDTTNNTTDTPDAPAEQVSTGIVANDEKEPPSPTGTDNEEICFICANPIQYHSIAPCNHMTCHICSLRMRALYKTKQCPHCRTNSDYVIFTTNDTKSFEEYSPSDIAATDETLGIKYEGKQIRADTLVLLRYNCPEPNCDVACLGWPDLHRHVRNTHKLVLCDLCTRFKKVFTHEHTLFTYPELRKHERYGDDVPGTEDQSGFKGHPECGFCHKRFYGDDELYNHCKEAHERCFICDRESGGRPNYFLNWEALEEHFKQDHYRCTDAECLEKKFIVFASEMDLKAHVVEEHPQGLSKGALKDMRKVDMSAFGNTHTHGGGSTSRGRGGRMQRDYRRDPQAPEPPPPDGPMRRDEIAYHRTLAVQTAQNTVPPRMFGGQLTRPPQPIPAPAPAPAARPTQAGPPPVSQPVRAAARQEEAFPPLGALNTSSPPTQALNRPAPTRSAPVTQTAQSSVPANVPTSTAQKHEQVVGRATRLLNGDSSKLETFKKYISSYNSEKMSARDLIEAFWVLFNVQVAADLATLLRELSELFEKEEKRRKLLEAWHEWKSVNEDYPPMPGSSSGATAAGAGGARVLKLKSATNRNLRAGASPWSAVTSNTIERGGGSLADINGGGRIVPGAAVTVAGKGKAPVTSGSSPWASAVRNTGSVPSRGVAAAGRGRAAVASSAEFPSLPKAPPKYAPVPRKNEGKAPASVWSASNAAGAGPSGSGSGEGGPSDLMIMGVKGKGKKKQQIISWG